VEGAARCGSGCLAYRIGQPGKRIHAAIAGEAKIPTLTEHLTLHKVLDGIYKSAADRRDVEL
jgi:hypothetical protein